MPLGERAGFEKSQSRYRGVETEFNDNVPQLLNFNLSTGAFDFVVAILMNPSYRPSLLEEDGVLPFAASDLVLSPSPWSSHVVGKNSSWIDLDSEDETLRMDSETTLKQEIAWANHLSIQVWYEWCVTSPDPSAIHNSSGRSYWEGCQSDELRVAWMETILIDCACPNTDLDGTYEAVSKCSI